MLYYILAFTLKGGNSNAPTAAPGFHELQPQNVTVSTTVTLETNRADSTTNEPAPPDYMNKFNDLT